MLEKNPFHALLVNKQPPWRVLDRVVAISIGAGFATSSGARLPMAEPYTPPECNSPSLVELFMSRQSPSDYMRQYHDLSVRAFGPTACR
jgi:hypothetical protein